MTGAETKVMLSVEEPSGTCTSVFERRERREALLPVSVREALGGVVGEIEGGD